MQFVDTHCHIHETEFFKFDEAESALQDAIKKNVTKIVCIATSLHGSKEAITFAHKFPENCWASVGIHPHEATRLTDGQIDDQLAELDTLASDQKVVAIGECGFDFHYNKREEALAKQIRLLTGQLEIAKKHNLPVSFHVRSAFKDFWPLYDKFKLAGVLHSFTDTKTHMQTAIERGLYIGVNGIATFTKDSAQTDMFKSIPLEKMVLETDSPFLTPVPKRGKLNSPENVTYITEYLAELRGENARTIADRTTDNARELFKLS